MNAIEWMQSWYEQHCNEEWEHQYGVFIETLDNPGWLVKIDLTGTELAGYRMDEVGHEAGINHAGLSEVQEWLYCKVENDRFIGAGGPRMLLRIVEVFRTWAESKAAP